MMIAIAAANSAGRNVWPSIGRRAKISLQEAAISIQAISWVLEHSRSRLGPRHVLISIANHADRLGGNAYPSLETIGLEARLTSRQVVRALPILVDLGELEIERGAGQRGRGGTTNRYRLPLMGKLESPENLSPLSNGAELQPHRESPDKLSPLLTMKEGKKSTSRGDISNQQLSKMSHEPSGTVDNPKTFRKSVSKSIDSDIDEKKRIFSNPRDLFAVLDIDPERIRRAEGFAMKYLARAWQLEPPAAGPENLIAWLDAKINWLAEQGQRYPKVVLARLKQLQRGGLPREAIRRKEIDNV